LDYPRRGILTLLFAMNKLLQKGGLAVAVLATLVALMGLGIPSQFVDVHAPATGDRWRVGHTYAIEWLGVEVAGPYRIELQRQPRGKWEMITRSTYGYGTDDGWLAYDWRATGPVTRRAQIRITALDHPEVVGYSGIFTIYRDSHSAR